MSFLSLSLNPGSDQTRAQSVFRVISLDSSPVLLVSRAAAHLEMHFSDIIALRRVTSIVEELLSILLDVQH